MTPEETKTHVESRLRELGWSVLIGRAGYEKIARLTGDDQAGIERLCRKLISLGTLQDQPRITDDMVELAMLDLDPAERQSPGRIAAYDPLPDLPSIEELAAKLDARAKGGSEVDSPPPRRPVFRGVDAGRPQPPPPPPLPKLLLVQADARRRAALAAALSDAFAVLEVGDGADAWRALSEQNDIELLVTDVHGPELDAYQLIRRLRESTSPTLVGVPIIVIGEDQDEEAKMRLLRAGANDFVRRDIDPRELCVRAVSRHRVSRDAMRVVMARASAQPRVSAAPARAKRAAVTTLTAERPQGAAVPRAQGAKARAANSVTTKITVIATLLLAVGIAAVIYISRNYDELRLGELDLGLRLPAEGAAPGTDAASSDDTAHPGEPTSGDSAAPVEAPKPAGRATPESPPSAASAEEPPRNVGDPAPDARSEAPSAPTRTDNGAEKAATPAPTLPASPAKRAERPRAAGAPGMAAAPEPPRASDSRAAPPPPAPAPAHIEAAERTPTAEELAKVTPPTPAPVPPVRREALRSEAARDKPTESTASPSVRPSAPATPRANGGVRAREPSSSTPPPAARPRPNPVPTPRQEPARTEPPVAAAPPTTTPPAPPLNRISRDELSSLLARFASVYESGDLEQFMSLFGANARTNDRNDPAGIRRDYESLFRTTDLREMQLGEISWEVDGNQAQGWGEFNVSVRRRGDSEIFRYAGSLTMVVEKVDGRLRIVRLYHGQRRIEAASR